MKFFAILQIFLLLATCVVPEGRHLLSKGGCSNGCGCSAESRQAGNCCCSTQATKATVAATPGCSNCKAAESQKPVATQTCSNCPTEKAPRTCCSTAQSTCCSSSGPASSTGPEISSCPCGDEVWELQVIMMPRVKAARIEVCCDCAKAAAYRVQDNRPIGERSQPESPPPKNLPC